MAKPATLCAPASSATLWLAPMVSVGASLTALTVMVNSWAAEVSTPPLAVPPLSLTSTVTLATPLASATRV